MKAGTIGCIAGVIVTAIASWMMYSGSNASREARLRSEVHTPIRVALDDIAATIERGEVEIGRRKAALLAQRWSEYLDGGPRPEQFLNEVTKLRAAGTQPTR